jgi:hypothetical protein
MTAGEITCGVPDCPNPRSIYDVLAEEQHEHRVRFFDGHFIVQHPLRERVEGTLFDCSINDWILLEEDLPVKGEFRATRHDRGWMLMPAEKVVA